MQIPISLFSLLSACARSKLICTVGSVFIYVFLFATIRFITVLRSFPSFLRIIVPQSPTVISNITIGLDDRFRYYYQVGRTLWSRRCGYCRLRATVAATSYRRPCEQRCLRIMNFSCTGAANQVVLTTTECTSAIARK